MGAVPKTLLYETDFVRWAEETAALLRAGRLDRVDLDLVAEEIEGLAKHDKRAVASHLKRLMMHLLKMRYQPERGSRSWLVSVVNARQSVRNRLKESPSLRSFLHGELEECYRQAIELAETETGLRFNAPPKCPWSVDALLSSDIDRLVRS